METINLAELYDSPTMSWEAVRDRLESDLEPGANDPGTRSDNRGPQRYTCWLHSLNADGSPHANAVGATWSDERFWFVTGLDTRRGRNLARDPRCVLAVSLRELDLVIEGRAALVQDPALLARLAGRWAAEGWPCEVDAAAGALTAPYSAQSAGPPPWHVFGIEAASAHGVEVVEPYGATRWRF